MSLSTMLAVGRTAVRNAQVLTPKQAMVMPARGVKVIKVPPRRAVSKVQECFIFAYFTLAMCGVPTYILMNLHKYGGSSE